MTKSSRKKYACSDKGRKKSNDWKYGGYKSSYNSKDFYGEQSDHIENDIFPVNLEKIKSEYYEAHVKVSEPQAHKIEIATCNQDNDEWLNQRRIRCTGSELQPIITRDKRFKLAPPYFTPREDFPMNTPYMVKRWNQSVKRDTKQ